MAITTRKAKARARPGAAPRPAKTVEFSVGSKRPLHTHKVRAFAIDEPVDLPVEIGIDLPAETKVVTPSSGTFLSFGLGGRPGRKRALLLDVTGLGKEGTTRASRRVQGQRVSRLYYFEAGAVYAAQPDALLTIVGTRSGHRVDLRGAAVEALETEVGGDSAGRVKKLNLAMSSGVPAATVQWDKAEATALLERARSGVAAQPQAATQPAPQTHDPWVCGACLWEAHNHLAAGSALMAQWWNPFAVMVGIAETAIGHQILVYCLAGPCR